MWKLDRSREALHWIVAKLSVSSAPQRPRSAVERGMAGRECEFVSGLKCERASSESMRREAAP